MCTNKMYKNNVILVLIIFIFNVLLIVHSQYVQSPCPEIFNYESDGANIYGIITLRSSGPVSFIQLKTKFTIAAQLPSRYIGRIEPLGTDLFLIQEFNRGGSISYRVHFPVTRPLPRLTSLTVNDNILCYGPGDIAGPNKYVTTIDLQHTLFLKSEGGIPVGWYNNNRFNERPKPQQTHEFVPWDNDAQTNYYYYPNDNRNEYWNTNTHPEYEPPKVSPQPDRSQYPVYYPEQTTQPPLIITVPPPRELPSPPPPERPPPVNYPTRHDTPTQKPSQTPSNAECGLVAGGNERQPLIYHGQQYARGDWPWLVAIYKRNDGSLSFICSGTLVSDRHVISAAHCLHQKNTVTSIRDIVVKVGVYNLEDWGDDITVTRTLAAADIHESYNATTLANDILVFTFERSIQYNINIRPACLWNGNTDLQKIVGKYGVVAGWGKNELGPAGHGEPRFVRIPVVSTATCRASNPDFHKLTSSNTFCAGDRNGVGPCLGDSGGGLYILEDGRWRIRGVVSLSLRPANGENTCNLNEYIIFTDSAKYLGWIQNIMYS